MGLMKKLKMQGIKSPKYSTDRLVRRTVVQLDLFEGSWFYHERELLYVPEKENVSTT